MLMVVTNEGGDAETNEMRGRHVSIQDSPVLELEQKQPTSGAGSLPHDTGFHFLYLGLISSSNVINSNKPYRAQTCCIILTGPIQSLAFPFGF